MSSPPESFTAGSLYLAGFAQAQAPHTGLLIATNTAGGFLVHIRIDRNTSPNWAYQGRKQRITGDVFMNSLVRLHDVSEGEITREQLEEVAMSTAVPDNDEFGECFPWVLRVIEGLHEKGLVRLENIEDLKKEFQEFAEGNRMYATSSRFPNVRTSRFCS
ncbi:hypothetical protein PHLCEN_2v12484 [Hermanssonia centrifuga]|uniref:Uncharacterized protein n=1 Tax=Hermanssonia centrifuga TaxID=98765 RepID=A0A2R6NH52_9APHY|nr:hypothetical protein PHLCEN_2v12484 [Hermanssonia centrifuga]